MNRFPIRAALAACCLIASASMFAQTAAAPAPFRQEGIASWYGSEYDGKPTASGEAFDSKKETAAHPTLPFGTMLRITNTQNGKMTIVRVNDRGPYVSARIVDVSRAAAEKLDMLATGTAPVVIETAEAVSMPAPVSAPDQALPNVRSAVIPEAPPVAEAPAVSPAPAPQAEAVARVLPGPIDPTNGKRYRLQVGSYKMARYAAEAFEKLKAAGIAAAYERNGELYRVVVPEIAASEIDRYARELGAAGFSEVLAREIR